LLNISEIRPENKGVLIRRPIYGGNLIGTFESPEGLLICTIAASKIDNGMINMYYGKSQLLVSGWPLARTPSTIRSVERSEKIQESSLDATDIFIVAGRGLGSRENVSDLKKLAELLGAEIGGTRPVIANGWLPRFRLVGISGVKVKPRICLVFGASGATPFIVGIENSEIIIGINDEKTALLFKSCDVGMIADCKLLINLFRDKILSREEL
jgi:electron transfer flavoprotein alpha subunit